MKNNKLLLLLVLGVGITLGMLAQQKILNGSPGSSAQDTRKVAYWVAPMDPSFRQSEPGKSPMGMDLVPVYEDELNGSGAGNAAGTMPGPAKQMVGVKTADATWFDFGQSVRAFGNVVSNPAAEVAIAPRVAGWIKTMTVFTQGDAVKKGQELFTLYSPGLISAQKDYLAAVASDNKRRVFASKARLRLLGFDAKAISRLDKAGKSFDNVPFHAPQKGTVLEVKVRGGSFVMAGSPVITLADYGTLWVEAEVAEQDIAFLKEGDWASLVFSNGDRPPLTGQIDVVYPTVNPKTRTGRVRIVIDNVDGDVRAGSYADIVFVNDPQRRLAVPSEAVLYDGKGARVVTIAPSGQYKMQMIKAGITADGMTEIKDGLKAGDQVVISGQFLIDADARIKGNTNDGGDTHANH